MKLRLPLLAIALVMLAATGCRLPGKPGPGPEVPNPDSVLDSKVLYDQNCSGCHGADGRHGAAVGIGDPVYLAIASEDTMRSVASKGRPGTAMSAFAQKEGGMLTDAQIDSIVRGIRQRWSNPMALAGATLPPYQSSGTGDAQRGEAAYNLYCASCHGAGGKGGPKAGSIVDPAYLGLITDQGLRTIVITGRPDFDAPDWRNNVPGRPMSDQEITDVVAWLASHRPATMKAARAVAGNGVAPGVEGARLQQRRPCCASLKEGGNQFRAALIPAQSCEGAACGPAEAVPLQRNTSGGPE